MMRHYNQLAIDYIENYSKERIEQATDIIDNICEMSNISKSNLANTTRLISDKARIAIHFHPYRLDSSSKSVLELLHQEGQYKSQFETKISNGSLTAYIGGKRDLWENVLFGQVFSSNNIGLSDRPKYGALDLLGHFDGASPRFGSCYFLLKPELTKYTTFCYLDSYANPKEKGTLRVFDDILASLLSECFERSFALGEHNIRPHQLLAKINQNLNLEHRKPFDKIPSRNLNHYIEAQVHTSINLKDDVDYLVADSSFKNTEYEQKLEQLCHKYQIELAWYKGFELPSAEVPNHFRGSKMPMVAEQIAENGKINAYILGKAEKRYQQIIQDEKQLKIKLQELKYLWHILVQYGNLLNY